jgi:acetyl-CoA carboxylase biotin carboxyl carrier protein
VSDKQDVETGDALGRVAAVIDAFESSDWEEIRLDTGQVVIHLSTAIGHETLAHPASSPRPLQPATVASAPPAPMIARSEDPVATAAAPMAAGMTIVAPSVGIFWRAPSPTAPPFVEPGDAVEADDPLCILEVMKLMTQVTSGQRGRIAQIRVASGEAVEKGQILFVLTPSA